MALLKRNVSSVVFLVVTLFCGVKGRGINLNIPGRSLENVGSINLTALENGDEFGVERLLFKAMIPHYIEDLLEISEVDLLQGGWLLEGVKSDQCKGHIQQWIRRAANLLGRGALKKEDVWMLHMFDAWGKPPEGLLEGHVNAFGDFNECVNIQVKDLEILDAPSYSVRDAFEGRYCTSYFSPYDPKYHGGYFNRTKLSAIQNITNPFHTKAVSPSRLIELMRLAVGVLIQPSIAVCFPNTCEMSDIQTVMMNAFRMMYSTAGIILPDKPKEELIWPRTAICYDGKKPDLDAGDWSVIALLSVIVGLVLFATILDIFMSRGAEKPPRRGLALQYLNSFSLYTNIMSWLSTRQTADDLGCLHGIRVLSTCWVVLAHTWYVITFVPYWNSVEVKLVQEDWTILTILNSTVAVDTFFVLSGLLVCFNVLKMLQKTKGKLNLPMFYIHRYLRLTPVYAVLVGIMATLLPYLGRGPYWFWMDRWANICENNWWTNVLYVNNFINTTMLCQGEAWYLANDMQFYIVSPVFIYPLFRWEMIGIGILVLGTILSTLSPILMVHYLDTVPTTIGTRDSLEWFLDIYIKPYARIQTYLVGIWLGWILFKTRGKKVRLPIPLVALFWIISTGSCLASLYAIYPWFDPTKEIPEVSGLMYAGFSRLSWGLSMAWIIFACVKGYGGLVNDFLSWTVFMPLGRVCYCVYLVSLHLQMILHVQQKQPAGYSEYNMMYAFFGHLIMAFLVGFIFTLTVETPFMKIEKLIFEGPAREPRGGGGNNAHGIPPATNGQSRNGIFYNTTESIVNGEVGNKQEKQT